MKTPDSQAAPAPPNLVAALLAGFDAIANQLLLIAFPVALDLFIWFGPHLKLSKFIEPIIEQISSTELLEASESGEMLIANPDALMEIADQLNIMTVLRSYPIGIPSLMAGRMTSLIPTGVPFSIDIETLGLIIFAIFILTIIGLLIGTFFFGIVAQAALSGEIHWKRVVSEWPWASLQIFILTLIGILLLLGISVPFSCLISVIALGGIPFSQILLIIYIGLILWIFFPLILTPQGIFVNHESTMKSIKRSISITRLTLPTTGLFFLVIVVVSQGLDLLWRVPEENTWWVLVGIIGHAFVATGLLAATFIYYRDADMWAKSVVSKLQLSSTP
jgi:hypothetical protein